MTFIEKISSNRKVLAVLLTLILIIGISCFLWMKFHSVLDEGATIVSFGEIDKKTAESLGNISHLSDQDYREFPGLKEVVDNQVGYSNWDNGSRFLGSSKIDLAQRSFINSKYFRDDWRFNNNILEYGGRYYTFSISIG